MESTVMAALSLLPNVPAEVDLVSDVASLGNLLRFILNKDKTFRVVVQVIGETVFFVRRENSPTETLEDIRGHGHTFLETHTTWDADMKGSSANHRIMTYRFGGLKMLVRYEADAYIPDPNLKRSPATTSPPKDSDPDLSTLLSDLKTSPTTTTHSSPSNSIKHLTNPDQPVAQSQIVEIKTRGHWKEGQEDTVAEDFPKLWLAQVPHMIVAYHKKGLFSDVIPVVDVRDRVRQFERVERENLACFAALLWRILNTVKEWKGGDGIELVRTGDGDLKITHWGKGTARVLSNELEGRWIAGKETQGEEEEDDVGDNLNGDDGGSVDLSFEDWENNDEKDWTECSVACGYCGECKGKARSR